ncbi:hypothetical protein CIB95_14040 [Lottiidibacillus patelloidae]|uniref:DUF86 domain-containing protein n=1 Tax=Lottiidibacillus patelloidae TaxID=2670334 RepID=A0A263BQG9_9BACI|nr:DUF86 domain-containing protein [Lottiidibacillus patelloidae]OZM55964.1 hypothetical protein CIB95_14040 [Lottiidibacillus patelloidae]
MYFVDRKKIEESLLYIEEINQVIDGKKEWNANIEKLAIERAVHMIIEAIIDVGNAMIDGFIMRDPGSYEDIVEILRDESVVSSDASDHLKELISLRKELIYGYHGINHEKLITTLSKVKQALTDFPVDVRRYLTDELGPVSAFIPDANGGKE